MCARTVNAQFLFLLMIPLTVLLSGCGGPADSSVEISSAEQHSAPGHDKHEHDKHGHDKHEHDKHEHDKHEHDKHDHDEHDHAHHIADHRPVDYADLVRQLERRPSLIHAEAGHDMRHAAHELEELRDIIAWLPEIAADTDLVKRDWDDANRIAGELAKLVPAQARAFVERMKPGSDAATEYQRRVDKLSTLIPLAVQD
jgi:hypothetical protein